MCCNSGPDPSQFDNPTPEEKANTEIAIKDWNHYLESIKPVADAYRADVTGDIAPRVGKVEGMGNADIMQGLGAPAINPNRAFTAAPTLKIADTANKIDLSAETGAHTQKAAAMQGLLDLGQGRESTAQAGISDLAQGAVRSNIRNAESEYNADASINRSIVSGLGMAAGAFKGGKK